MTKINAFFKNFDQTLAIHRWVQRRTREGLPTPSTMEEFLRMSAVDSKGLNSGDAGRPGKGRGRLGMSGASSW